MNTCKKAAIAALVVLPATGLAQDDTQTDESVTDEIVIVGRSVSTSSVRVEVEREILVDSAAVLKDFPGANVNRNGALTGIAQYRGMYGDRISVDIDDLGMVSGGPNAMDTPGLMGMNVGMLADALNSADRDLSFNSVDAVLKYRRKLSARTEWVFEVGSKTRAPSYQSANVSTAPTGRSEQA